MSLFDDSDLEYPQLSKKWAPMRWDEIRNNTDSTKVAESSYIYMSLYFGNFK